MYRLVATNSVGNGDFNFTLDVLCKIMNSIIIVCVTIIDKSWQVNIIIIIAANNIIIVYHYCTYIRATYPYILTEFTNSMMNSA